MGKAGSLRSEIDKDVKLKNGEEELYSSLKSQLLALMVAIIYLIVRSILYNKELVLNACPDLFLLDDQTIKIN